MKELLKELGFEHLPMLSEFVKRIYKDYDRGLIGRVEIVNDVWAYTYFITQPLTKGMFVTCDENGEVLRVPTGIDFQEYLEQYQQAKDRVLFDGWYRCEDSSYSNIDVLKSDDDDLILRYSPKHGIMMGTTDLATIEQAINAGIKLKLKT